MRIGGGGREQWIVVLPVAGLVVLMTVFFGGPEPAFRAMESMFYDAAGVVSTLFRH
jgi:hypothetical protein